MSTTSNIGSVFGSLGSGVATFGGPIGMAAGAGFSVLGGLIGLAGKIKDKRAEEEEQKRLLEEARRKEMGDIAQAAGDQQRGDSERPKQAHVQPQASQPSAPQQPQAPMMATGPEDQSSQGLAQQQLLSPEIQQMLAGLRPGGGGFYG